MSDKIPRQCANEACKREFLPKVHNAIYCGDECRKLITNQKVLDKYYEKKEKSLETKTIKRICATDGCGTILSIYNEDSACSACQKKRTDANIARLGLAG